MKENKFLKFITFLLYIAYIVSMVFFIKDKELGRASISAFCIVATFTLYIVNKNSKILISNSLYIVIVAFIFFASLFGSCYNFYDINHYDDFLHIWSGFISCSVAFSIINFFNTPRQIRDMSKIFVFIFLLMFSMGVSSVWEIVEFSIDKILGLNTQAGGLEDTIIDMIDALVWTLLMIPFTIRKIRKI